jgi:hypothetical protein
MTWQVAGEHQELLVLADRVVSELSGLRARLQHRDDTEYGQHGQFAERARGLAGQLEAAVTLTRADLYGPAFGCLRVALEQTQVDHLVFLGRRVIQTVEDVDETTWTEWNRQREAGERFPHVVDWSRTRRGTVEIISKGLRLESAEGTEAYAMSPHYFLLEEFQPYLGPPSAQAMFDDGLTDLGHDRDWAERNATIYRTYLTWSSLKRNMQLNGFADELIVSRLDVHYRFLSAFVHPLTAVDRILYGRNTMTIPSYDHYSSELALLYVVAFGVTELRNFVAMLDEPPVIGLRDGVETNAFVTHAWDSIAYMWLPGHRPHWFDRVTEANVRAFRELRETETRPNVADPATFKDEDISYYRDPMARLVKLHAGFNEIVTGLSFVPPWARRDAQYR